MPFQLWQDRQINKNVVTLPVHIGDVVIADVFGSNIVVTENKA